MIASVLKIDDKNKMGSGVTGKVYNTTDPRVVCKRPRGDGREASECTLREASCLLMLKDCPYVPNLVSAVCGTEAKMAGDDKGRLCLFIDKYDCDLQKYFADRKGDLSTREILWISHCILRALYDAECLSITHRDVKLQNIFIRVASPPKSPLSSILVAPLTTMPREGQDRRVMGGPDDESKVKIPSPHTPLEVPGDGSGCAALCCEDRISPITPSSMPVPLSPDTPVHQMPITSTSPPDSPKDGKEHADPAGMHGSGDSSLPSVVLGDWGNARFAETLSSSNYSNPAQTLWYRAPEVMMDPDAQYSSAINVWSVGIIMYELFAGRNLVCGLTDREQLVKLFEIFGTPTEATWPGCTSMEAWKSEIKQHNITGRKYRVAAKMPMYPSDTQSVSKFRDMLNRRNNVPPRIADLIVAMLAVNPKHRATTAYALSQVCLSLLDEGLAIDLQTELRQTCDRAAKPINLIHEWQAAGVLPSAPSAPVSGGVEIGSEVWSRLQGNQAKSKLLTAHGLSDIRRIVVQWMMESAQEFRDDIVERQCLFLSCRYLDTLLHDKGWIRNFPSSLIQLMAVCCLSIAGKIVCKIPPSLEDYLKLCLNAFTVRQFTEMFHLIHSRLGFQFFCVTEFTVLRELLQYQSTQEHKLPLDSCDSKSSEVDHVLGRACDLLYCCLLDERYLEHGPIKLAMGAIHLVKTPSTPTSEITLAAAAAVKSLLSYVDELPTEKLKESVRSTISSPSHISSVEPREFAISRAKRKSQLDIEELSDDSDPSDYSDSD